MSTTHATPPPRKRPAKGAARSKFVPRTELGRKLAELRKKIVASGAKLLSDDEIASHLARVMSIRVRTLA